MTNDLSDFPAEAQLEALEQLKVETASTPDIISPELTSKLGSLKAIALCHRLISQAPFPITCSADVTNAMSFLEALHTQLVEECVKDPQAKQVPELAQFIKE